MELEIIKEKENPLFGRKEIIGSIETPVTPSKNEVESLIVQKFSTQPEMISLKGIHGKFGSKSFMVNANIYSSSEEKKKAEPKKKVKGKPKQNA
jgi:ribosomal protein S24E